jgi:hypothetical protein
MWLKKLLFLSFVLFSLAAHAQDPTDNKVVITTAPNDSQLKTDTLDTSENYALDISQSSGLFIVTKDGKLQMRILGSVRVLWLEDFLNFPLKTSFDSYYVPIGAEREYIPNFFGSLGQSRLGFEVTRKLKSDKTVFIRLEMDFNGGTDQTFRIRHAYGQTQKLIVGQTWSLFSNITSQPESVNWNGPTGSVTLRTPQVRYYGSNKKGLKWAVALEYARPDLDQNSVDTLNYEVVQLIPDLTARFVKQGKFGAVQLSGVLTTVSLSSDVNKVSNQFGIGGSLSGTLDFSSSKILYQITYGTAISHYINIFSGTGNDAVFNPTTGGLDPIRSFGGILAYSYQGMVLKKLSSTVTLGYADLNNYDYQPADTYSSSMSAAWDSFWSFTEGSKLGLEYMYNQRWDKGGENGNASRISVLFYYDF